MNPPWQIRGAAATELALLARLHAASFGSAPDAEVWGEQALARILAMPGAFALLGLEAVSGRSELSPCGFAICRAAADELEILSIGVLPRARRCGLGTFLLRAVQEKAGHLGITRQFLEVAETNCAAQRLYCSAGFREVGRRRGYYHIAGRRVAALVMSKP